MRTGSMVMNHGEKMFDAPPKEVFRHYKELEAIGLAAPQITYIVHGLKEHGVPIADDITTVAEARDAILQLLGKDEKTMIRDITLGQYYPVDSVLHRMDPRTKLFGTLVFIVSLFFANSIACYVAATLFLVTAIRMSKVPFSFMVRGLKAIVFLLLISVSFNLFLTPGHRCVQFGSLRLPRKGSAPQALWRCA